MMLADTARKHVDISSVTLIILRSTDSAKHKDDKMSA